MLEEITLTALTTKRKTVSQITIIVETHLKLLLTLHFRWTSVDSVGGEKAVINLYQKKKN